MFFPIGDSPNPEGFRPWVNWLIITINILIFVVITLPMGAEAVDPRDPAALEYLRTLAPELGLRSLPAMSAYDLFVFEHGFRPAAASWNTLLSAMFLHSGVGHILGNMLFLWIYGDNVEHRLGRLGYLVAYLLTGVTATLGFAALAPGSNVPMIGASGAISGVLGLYFLFFPKNVVRMLIVFLPFGLRVFPVNARFVLTVYVVADNLLPLLVGASSGVAYGAHLGGFFGGLALAGGINLFARREALATPEEEPSPDLRTHRELLIGQTLLKKGQSTAAYHHLLAAAESEDPRVAARARALLNEIRPREWYGR